MRRAGPALAAGLTESPVTTLHNVSVSWVIGAVKRGDAIEVIAKAVRRIVNQFTRVKVVTPGIAA